jgi:sulfotransferase
VQLFPSARVIVCARDMAWIMDSFERMVRKNPFLISKIYGPDTMLNVHTRTNSIGSSTGVAGASWESSQEAFYGSHADRLVVIDYEALAREPQRTMEFIYDSLGLPQSLRRFQPPEDSERSHWQRSFQPADRCHTRSRSPTRPPPFGCEH